MLHLSFFSVKFCSLFYMVISLLQMFHFYIVFIHSLSFVLIHIKVFHHLNMDSAMMCFNFQS